MLIQFVNNSGTSFMRCINPAPKNMIATPDNPAEFLFYFTRGRVQPLIIDPRSVFVSLFLYDFTNGLASKSYDFSGRASDGIGFQGWAAISNDFRFFAGAVGPDVKIPITQTIFA